MSRIFILTLLLFSSLYAREVDEFPFIGVTVSTYDISVATLEDNPSDTKFGIRYGRQTVDWRTMLTYSMNSHYDSFALEVDMFLLDKLFGSSKFRPYLGLSVGSIKFDNQDLKDTIESNQTSKTSSDSDSEDVDTSGYYYGFNAGLTIYATDNVDADISYYYNKVQDFVDIDEMQGMTFALHYFY